MTAPLCMTFGFPADDEVCCDCSTPFGSWGRFVNVGRLDVGRLCEGCAEATPFGEIAEALDRLDTAVVLTADPGQQAAAAINVQQAVQHLVEDRWMPRALAGMTAAGDQ